MKSQCLMGLAAWFACAALGTFAGAAEPVQRLLLIGQQPDNHPVATHEYLPGVQVLAHLLRDVPGLQVEVVAGNGAWDEGPRKIDQADGVFLFVSEGARWVSEEPRRLDALARLAERGGGLGVLHWGMGTREAEPIAPFVRLFGGCHGGPDRKYQVVDVTLRPATKTHPVLSGIGPIKLHEELYYRLKFPQSEPRITPLLLAKIDGADETVAWGWERADKGRSFGYSGLHFHDNWSRPEIRRLVAQGALWMMKRPIHAEGLAVEITDETLKLPRERPAR